MKLRLMENEFTHLLLGKDLRKLGRNQKAVEAVTDQHSFDELFVLTFHHERSVAMRAVDAVEKITRRHPRYLQPHKSQLLSMLGGADHKELKWHLAQLVARIDLNKKELEVVNHFLTYWALNKNESKIVRVNALQGLFELAGRHPEIENEFKKTLGLMEHEMIPSIQARIRKLKIAGQSIL